MTPKKSLIKQTKDGLVNLVANMGTNKDKRTQGRFTKTHTRLDRTTLEALYREDFIAGKAIDIVADDMTREWRTFNDSDLDDKLIENITDLEKHLKVQEKVNSAQRWARLYGGSIIVMDIENTGEPWEPLRLDMIKEGSLRNLVVFDAENANAVKINTIDPMATNFRMPETYSLAQTSTQIHESRVLRFDGQPLPYFEFQRNRYWGDSILARPYNQLLNFNTVLDSIAGLVLESNVDVIKVPDLINMLSNDASTSALIQRFSMAKILKSNNNMTLISGEEELIKQNASFAGLPEVMAKFFTVMSSCFDIPATRLFGVAPTGMNATGESDLTNYYDSIASDQKTKLDPPMQRLDAVMALSLGIDPEDMDYKWNPLWQLSEGEQAIVDKTEAETSAIYLTNSILLPSHIAKKLQASGDWPSIDDEYISQMEEFEQDIDNDLDDEVDDKDEPVVEPEEKE